MLQFIDEVYQILARPAPSQDSTSILRQSQWEIVRLVAGNKHKVHWYLNTRYRLSLKLCHCPPKDLKMVVILVRYNIVNCVVVIVAIGGGLA